MVMLKEKACPDSISYCALIPHLSTVISDSDKFVMHNFQDLQVKMYVNSDFRSHHYDC